MSKKKKKQQQPQLSPENYIRTRARQLEIGPCYISSDYKEHPQIIILVSRRHKQGTLTVGLFSVETGALGLQQSHHYFNVPEEDYEEIRKFYSQGEDFTFIPVSYELAHNYIYGAIAWAEEAGFVPCKDFELTDKYILEEDTDDVPLIEIEFGKDGRHMAFCGNEAEARWAYNVMSKHLAPGEFDCCLSGNGESDRTSPAEETPDLEGADINELVDKMSDEDVMEFAQQMAKDGSDFLQDLFEHVKDKGPEAVREIIKTYTGMQQKLAEEQAAYPDLPYSINDTYDYPTEVKLSKTLQQLFLTDELYADEVAGLPKAVKANIQRMKPESLRQQLLQTILFAIENYRTHGEKKQTYNLHLAFELISQQESCNDEEVRNVMLQTLKQTDDFFEEIVGMDFHEFVPPFFAEMFKGHTDDLLNRLMANDGHTAAQTLASDTIKHMCENEYITREETVTWYTELLTFWHDHWDEHSCCDATDVSFVLCDLMHLHMKELRDLVKRIGELDHAVNHFICGDINQVLKELN